MKKWILRAGIALWLMCFLFIVGFQNRKTDLYENMVDASVMISNDYDYDFGSGVFIDDDVILTAAHCLEDVKTIIIELSDGTILKSEDFYIDDEEDIAFIFVTANEPYIAKMFILDIHIGDIVYLVGRPFDDLFKFSLTKGILSHLGRDFPNMGWEDLLQTDATGGPGSSGGPLYNPDGNLVGMYVGHTDGGGQGISLCESAKSILEAYERCMESRNAPN